MAANIFMGKAAVSSIFVIGRVFIGTGMIVTCLLLARTLRQEADNAVMAERARMTESLLDIQREQYRNIARNIEQTKTTRHDMRHQLAAIGQFTNDEKVKSYVEELLARFPKRRCGRIAVTMP